MKNLAMRWLAGWSASTGHPWTSSNGIVRIEPIKSACRFEYLLFEPATGQISETSKRVNGDSRDTVTVFTTEPGHYLNPIAGLTLDRDDEVLMTVQLRHSGTAVPAGFSLRWEEHGDRVTLSIERGGAVAASGSLAVVGHDAIFDRVETMPRFRRQGLGRLLMGLLASWAYARGAHTGILAASDDGRRLYEALGWQREGAMLMFRGSSRAAG